jgi:deazaflavin-dependent oxidoreductase (nitroreductase family)
VQFARRRLKFPLLDPHACRPFATFRGLTLSRKLKRAVQKLGKLSVNKLVVALLRSGLSIPPVSPKTVAVVATVGRRSGRPTATPMGYVRIDEDRLWVVSEHGFKSDWYRNARAAGNVEVRLGRQRYSATVHPLPAEEPGLVLRRMKSRTVALANRLLWHNPKVVEIRLGDGRVG